LLWVFQIRSLFCLRPGLDFNLPVYASHVAGSADVNHHICLFVEMRSHFCPDWPQTDILPISASWVAGITDMSYWTPLESLQMRLFFAVNCGPLMVNTPIRYCWIGLQGYWNTYIAWADLFDLVSFGSLH
jgi:hypothetical protein